MHSTTNRSLRLLSTSSHILANPSSLWRLSRGRFCAHSSAEGRSRTPRRVGPLERARKIPIQAEFNEIARGDPRANDVTVGTADIDATAMAVDVVKRAVAATAAGTIPRRETTGSAREAVIVDVGQGAVGR